MRNCWRNAIALDAPIGQVIRSKMLAATDQRGETSILNSCITQWRQRSY